MPVTLSIAALPITVSGLGSAQIAMLALYGGFADGARIVAYSLAYSASLVLLRLPIGLLLWPAVMVTPPAITNPWSSRSET